MKKEVIEVVVVTDKAVQSTEKLNKSLNTTKKTGDTLSTGLNAGMSALPAGIQGGIRALQAFKVALVSTGVGAIVVALGAMVSLFVAAGNKGAEFSKAMSGVKAVLSGTDAEMKALSKSAKELGSTTEFTAVQVAGLQTELAKLGFRTDDILNASAATLTLASSLGIGLADAASFAGSTLKSFGLDTSETQRVVDVMSKSTATSALDFESLRESLKLIAPTSRALNIPIEETTALLGILADNGLKGSIAGTGLSKTFIALNAKGLNLSDAFKKLDGSSNKLNTAIDLVGIIGAKSLLTLSENSGGIDTLTTSLYNVEDAAKLLSEIRLDNLAGDTTKLGSAWEGFLLGIEDGEGIINKVSRSVVQFVTGLIDVTSNLFTLFSANFNESKNTISSYWTITKDIFSAGVESIKIAFNSIGLALAEVPFLGKAIDKASLQSNIDVARDEIIRLKKEIDDSTLDGTYQSRVLLRLIEFEDKKNKLVLEKNKELVVSQNEEKEKETFAEWEKRNAQIVKDLEAAEIKKQKEKEVRDAANESLQEYLDEEEKIITDAEDVRIANEYEAGQKKIKIEEEVAAAKAAIQDAQLNNIGRGFALLGQMAGKNRALQAIALIGENAVGIAKQVIATRSANALVTAKYALLPGGIALAQAEKTVNNIGLGIGIASSVAATAKGLSALKAGGNAGSSGSAQSAGGGGGSSSVAQAPQFNIVGSSGTNQLASAIGGQTQQPIKAYVVSNDVTTGQSLDRNIVESATIG